MKLKLNGEEHRLSAGASIPDVLGILGFEAARGVAVAVDGEVVPRSEWGEFALSDGMRVEVLRAVQGG
ncbi:MAG TPA: sulfur carrier protein ThiS [Actinomycetota bacterium]|jgi:sulfur carrier protein|nr:sulfur carrier protein ThiS [Actinomycetota bacterium]